MVDPAQLLYLNAFRVLDKSRQGKRIGVCEMEAYTRMFHVDDVDLFVRVVQELDDTMLRLKAGDNKD